MGYRKVRFDNPNTNDAPTNADWNIDPGDSWIVAWQLETITGSWPNPPNLNGGGYRVTAVIGGANNFTTGSITAELLVNGVVVATETFTSPYGNIIWLSGVLTSIGFPEQELGVAEHTVSVRVTNNTDDVISVSEGVAEADLYLEIEEYYPDTPPTTEEEECDELYVTVDNSDNSVPDNVESWTSSSLAVLNDVDTIGLPYDIAFKQDQTTYLVAESRAATNGGTWAANTEFGVDFFIEADGKKFTLTSVTGPGAPDTGFSGAVEPTWPGSGDVIDNELTWTYGGPAYAAHNLIEEFVAGTSTGEWGPDLNALDIQPIQPMALCCDSNDHVWLLAWLDDFVTLKLFHIDDTGVLVDSWSVTSDYTGGQMTIDKEAGATGKVYYTVHGAPSTGGVLYCFNPSTGLQESNAIELGSEDWFGAFKLLLGPQGGAVLSRLRGATDDSGIDVYTGCWTLNGFIPTETGETLTDALCYGEQQNYIWAGKGSNTELQKFDLLTFARVTGDLIIPSDQHNGIVSCTANRGKGRYCPSRRRVQVTLVGAS